MYYRVPVKRLATALALWAISFWLHPQPTNAHALLIRSLPEVNSELSEAPQTIELWFSEPLEEAFSGARIIDASGAEIPTGKAILDAADPTHISLPLGPMQPGIYTVAWKTLSRVDGHEWYGSFPLTILNPDGSRPQGGAAQLDESQRGELPEPLEVAIRWAALLGMMLLFGLPLFQLVVMQRLPAGAPTPQATGTGTTLTLASFVTALIRRLLWVAAAAILLASWVQVFNQAVRLEDLSQIPTLMTGTRTGQWGLVRQGVALLILVLVLAMPPGRAFRIALPLAAVGLLTFSVTSHAGAISGSVWAIAADYIHLLAAATWIGGLVLLPFLVAQARRLPGAPDRASLPDILLRFSYLASFAVFVLAGSGITSSLVELPSLNDLINSAYGQVLIAKLVLIVIAMELAFFNRRVVHAQAQRLLSAKGTRAFHRVIAIEAAVALLLMVTVAILVQTPTPRGVAPATAAAVDLPFNTIARVDDLYIHLQITPNRAGQNRFWAHLYHADGTPIGEVQLVRLLFEYQEAELGQARVDLAPLGQDTYAAEGAYLSQPGNWNVSVYTRRRGMDDTLADVSINVLPASVTAALDPWQNPVPSLPPGILMALWVMALGAVPLLWRKPLGNLRSTLYPALSFIGGALMVVGLGFGLGGALTYFSGDLANRPIPPTADSITAGSVLFQTHCSSCHGPEGMGNGPAGVALDPPPANMVIHVPLHDDSEIYNFIHHGFPGTAMPAFGEQLSNEEIWSLVHYLRDTFGGESGG